MDAVSSKIANQACCKVCRRIFAGKWIPWRIPASADGRWKIYEFHKTFQDLKNCARDHTCPICKIVLERGYWGRASAQTETTFAHIPEEDYLSINVTSNGGTSDLRGSCFITLKKSRTAPFEWLAHPSIGTSTFSAASFSFIKTKLDNCCENHSLCAAANDNFLPTRILDVLLDDDADDGSAAMVRLVNGKGLAGQYATLSHCWGRAQISRLLTTNQADFERGILVAGLPATFQQAIDVVRFLGIAYLWIDSLCIMQDSAADWEVESAAMAKVYGHALVNIAAASSSDSKGGLFFDRDPGTVQPFTAYAPGSGTLAEGWYTWRDDSRWGRIGDEPLHRRGWVLQERLLSSRTVHFTKSEVVWHCLQDLGSESVPSQVAEVGDATGTACLSVGQIKDYTDMRITAAKMQTVGAASVSRVRLNRDWKRLIGQYTKCGLTKGEDKLVAVFGIIDRLEKLTGDRCLAGMWRGQMPRCLLWLVDWGLSGPPQQPLRPTTWRAPSWSWASHDWAVEHLFCGNDALCYTEVVSTAVVRRQNGSVLFGKLALRGPIIDVDMGLVCGQVAAKECEGTILSVKPDGLPVHCRVRTDGAYDSMGPAKALLVMQDWAYLFLLIVPVNPREIEPVVFRRVGVLVIEGENQPEPVLLFPSGAGGTLSWFQYRKQIELV